MTTRTLTFTGYGVLLALILVWTMVTTRHEGRMTLSNAMEALTGNRAVRILLVIGWVWLGWHLFARGSGAFK